jgi:hypothetical protein
MLKSSKQAAHVESLKKHAFKPGKSGNPAGRPKGVVTIGQYYRDWLDAEDHLAAVTTSLLKSKAEVILHYAYGKPLETTATVDATGNLDTLIDRLTQLKRQRLAESKDPHVSTPTASNKPV